MRLYVMIRMQLYLTDRQDRALMRRAKSLGVSEGQLLRQALDDLLREECGDNFRRREALAELLENTRRLAENHRTPAGIRFDRKEFYAEREDRQD